MAGFYCQETDAKGEVCGRADQRAVWGFETGARVSGSSALAPPQATQPTRLDSMMGIQSLKQEHRTKALIIPLSLVKTGDFPFRQ